MTFRRKVCMAVLLACASACSQNTPPPEPAAFSRPTRVAFVCVDKSKLVDEADYLVPLSHCDILTVQAVVDPADAGTANYALHALVTQSSRGEVAAVEVAARHVIDNRPDIPGPTFLPTGEVPVAIVVAKDFPHTTYVANAGSRDISVLRTGALFKVQGAESFRKQRVSLQLSDADAPAVPFDMIVSPEQDALFVSSADAGWVARIPIKRCTDPSDDTCEAAGTLDMGGLQRIAVESSWAKLPESVFQPEPTMDEAYRFVCTVKNQPALLPTRDAPIPLPDRGADVGAPQPAGLALDAFCTPGNCTRRLLVADRHQPIVHAIDLDRLSAGDASEAVLPPILTGAPTERVTVTPRVPIDLNQSGETQYVYAIDARDGSVLVAQGDRVRNVSVDPIRRADRLDLGLAQAAGAPVALSLAIMTPSFDTLESGEQWVDPSDTAPAGVDPRVCVDPNHQGRSVRRLRGVFLAVGTTDGTVRVFNVHDMELKSCRDNKCDPTKVASYSSPYAPGYDPYPVVRNRARIAYDYATSTSADLQPVHPTVLPQFEVAGSIIGVKADGTTNDTRAAGLDCVSCTQTQAASFPAVLSTATDTSSTEPSMPTSDAGTPSTDACGDNGVRVCSLADPFVEPLSWIAVYEGFIPGTRGGRGRFVAPDVSGSGALEFNGETSFCKAGVLGDDALPAANDFPAAGDQLQIVSTLPNDQLRGQVDPESGNPIDNELCNGLIAARDTDNGAIAFQILKAYGDHLEIAPNLLRSSAKQPRATWEDVQKCFASQPLTYQIHTRGGFVVQGLGAIGFQHRVIEDASTHHCQNDLAQDALHTGRARPGQLFDNGLIAFKPSKGRFERLTALRLASQSNALKLVLNASDIGGASLLRGVMPVDMRYNPGDQLLYVVDITLRGLMPITLDPMSSIQPYSIQ